METITREEKQINLKPCIHISSGVRILQTGTGIWYLSLLANAIQGNMQQFY